MLSFFLCSLFFTQAVADDWELIKPVSGNKINLEVDGKKRSYWKIDHKRPVVIKVTGPGELKVLTRMVMPDNQKEGIYS